MRKSWNKIEYQPGEKIGACFYLHDVDQHVYSSGHKSRKAKFKCECGNTFEAVVSAVKNGNTSSCGCKSSRLQIYKLKLNHGMSDTPLHYLWKDIKKRCYTRNHKSFMDYGGRGIRVCDEWINDFKAFYNYVTQLPHYGDPDRSLDRFPDNDGNYEPGNVRWGTRHDQSTNQRPLKKTNKTGYSGIQLRKGRYYAFIGVNGKNTYIGSDPNIELAVKLRNDYITDNGLTEYKIQ